MATPTITPLPDAPSRQNSAGTFATQADTFLSALPQLGDQINRVIDHIDDQVDAAASSAELAARNGAAQVELAKDRATAAGQSAQAAGQQASTAKGHADNAKSFRDSAQAAAAASQSSAGLPALAGKGGLPLVVKPDGSGVEYSGSLRRYDLDVTATTANLDLSLSQVFKVEASQPRQLVITNPPPAGRAMSVVLHVLGKAEVTWPAGVLWNNNQMPVLGNSWTTVILIWIGDGWVGSVGARA